MTILSAMVLLFAVMDPLGNVPIFLSLLRDVEPARRRWVILRESVIALGVLGLFLWFGPGILSVLRVDGSALRVAGGIVLFLISLRMIFPRQGGVFGDEIKEGEPLVVPMAVPLLAGPSAAATVMLLSTQYPDRQWHWAAALGGAWALTLGVLLAGERLARRLGQRGMTAVERLMGMLLILIAVQMFMGGLREYFRG